MIRAHRISNYLVRAKLYLLERCVGSRQCKKRRWKVCTKVTETDTFSSTVTGEAFQINDELNFDDKCLIYLLKCKVCNKQYVGETVDAFHQRWKNYKDNDRKRVFVQLFWTGLFLDLDLWTRFWLYVYFVFILHLWSHCLSHLEAFQSICYVNWLIGLCVLWTLWLRCIVLTLNMFYLFYLSIYLLYVIFAFVYWYY